MSFTWIMSLALASPSITAPVKSAVTEVPSPIDRIFVPVGFDNNDAAEVIVHGDFTSDCQKVGRTGFTLDEKTKTIKVWATSYIYKDSSCHSMKVPFIQVVKLGILNAASYTVVWDVRPEVSGSLTIKPRTSEAPDDYLYAPVSNAHIHWNQDKTQQFLSLDGQFPHLFVGCMKMKEVRPTYYDSSVLVVLPIAEIISDDACGDDYQHDFHAEIPISQPMLQESLVHVRVLEGSSVNVLYSPAL